MNAGSVRTSALINKLCDSLDELKLDPRKFMKIKSDISRAVSPYIWTILQADFDNIGESKEATTRLAFPAFKAIRAMSFVMKKALDELLSSGRIVRVREPSRYAGPVFIHAVRIHPKEVCDKDLLNWKKSEPSVQESMEKFVSRLEKFY